MGGWGDCKAGIGNFIPLKEDGEAATVVTIGDPLVTEQSDKKTGRTWKRVYIAAMTKDKLAALPAKGEVKSQVLGINITTAEKLAKVLKAADPKASLAGKTWAVITRHGAKGAQSTTYDVELAGKLTPAEVKVLAKVAAANLEEIGQDDDLA